MWWETRYGISISRGFQVIEMQSAITRELLGKVSK